MQVGLTMPPVIQAIAVKRATAKTVNSLIITYQW
jgi:hypothetical protein